MWVASSAAAVEGTRQPGECGKKKSRKKRKTKQQKQNKRTEMRTQEQKQYGENGKYSHKCMKQNYNREETEGEELTASGRGGCPWKGRRL